MDSLRQSFPENADFVAMEAKAHRQLGDTASEISSWELFLEMSPRPVAACPRVAEAYESMGLLGEAARAYRLCLQTNPGEGTKASLKRLLKRQERIRHGSH